MKIGLLSPYDMFRAGGVQSHIKKLAANLRSRGHKVKIIAPMIEEKLEEEENYILLGRCAKVYLNKTEYEFSIAVGRVHNPIKEVLEEEGFDILHFHEPWVPAMLPQILAESEAVNIGTFHSTSPGTFVSRSMEVLLKPIAKSIVETLDEVIAVSQSPARYLRELFDGEIKIVPNGIDLKKYSPNNKRLNKYDDGKINVLYVGRLDKRKGVLMLIKAFRELKEKFDNARLIIAGKGEEDKKVRKYIKKHSLEDVELLGYVEEELKKSLYVTCDIFCSPALYGESFGIVLAEAMASGKPVVACSNSGYKSVLKGKGALLLVEPNDVKMLTQKLLLLCKDENLRKEMGKWGLKEVKKYSWEKVVDQLEDIYSDALKRKNGDEKTEEKEGLKENLKELMQKFS